MYIFLQDEQRRVKSVLTQHFPFQAFQEHHRSMHMKWKTKDYFVEIIVSIIFNLLRYVHSLACSLGLCFDVKFQREKKQSLKASILICYACCSL